METKSEKRERIRKNQGKMLVSGKSIFTVMRVKVTKAKKARGEKI